VGQGKKGKSATVRSLTGEIFNPEWDSTVGVEVKQAQVSRQSNSRPRVADWEIQKTQQGLASKLAAEIVLSRTREANEARRLSREMRHMKSVEEKYNYNASQPIPGSRKKRQRKRQKVKFDEGVRGVSFKQEATKQENPKPSFDIKDAELEYDSRLLLEAEKNHDGLEYSIWDYGGQRIFYTLHHMFLTQYGVYLLVFDMRDIVLKRDHSTVSETLKFWLRSIQLHAPSAPVLVIGTFYDIVKDEKALMKVNDYLGKLINEGKFSNVVKNSGSFFFPLDNVSRNGIFEIRAMVETVTRKQSFTKRLVKLKWLRCLDSAIASNKAWLSLSDMRSIGRRLGIKSTTEIDEMLSLFHELGMVLHFTGTDSLRQIIVVKPQWLINKVGCVIKDSDVHDYPMSLEKSGLKEDLNTFLHSGIASVDLLHHLWDNEQCEFLMDLLRQMLIMSDWKFNNETKMLIPSVIKNEHVFDTRIEADSNVCVFDFSSSFLPLGVFERLVCLIVQHSSSSSGTEPLIARNFSQISLPKRNGITIMLVNEPKLQRFKLVVLESENSDLAFDIVASMLRKIVSEAMHNRLDFSVLFKSREDQKGMIEYNEAKRQKLKPWFRDEPDAKNSSASGNKDSGAISDVINVDLTTFMEYLDKLD